MSAEKGLLVVGIDGSPASIKALEWAAKYAHTLDCTIEIITTWEPYIPSGELIGSGMALGLAIPELDPENIAAESIQKSIEIVFGASPPSHLIHRTLMGAPERVLVDESENATLLVVGSRGHGKLHDLVLGSVSSTCAAKAKCPVVVVHA
jgi:nucleotide-binding universal stress UspA family protein